MFKIIEDVTNPKRMFDNRECALRITSASLCVDVQTRDYLCKELEVENYRDLTKRIHAIEIVIN